MSLAFQAVEIDPRRAPENYLSKRGIFSWLFTTDHKRIGLLYLFSIIGFFAVGAVAALLMRLNLLTPRGDLVQAEMYNRLFTLHGVLMVWFFLIPSIPSVLGN
ncbi:MAG: cbb3-type cytochrome c oxidase subunit I, partial [Verrucomicrobia bacterium]|nr:cbb3-type cytochrome c oxidase subunit I [Verrucomicrobiota bacterium]